MSKGNHSFIRWIPLVMAVIALIAFGVFFAFNNHLPTAPKHSDVIIQPAMTNTPETPDNTEPTPEPTAAPTEIPTEIPTPTPAAIDAVDYFLALIPGITSS